LIESTLETEMHESVREFVHWLVEIKSQTQVSERRGEIVHGKVEFAIEREGEGSERRGEIVDGTIERAP
jgi:hypothetical protein